MIRQRSQRRLVNLLLLLLLRTASTVGVCQRLSRPKLRLKLTVDTLGHLDEAGVPDPRTSLWHHRRTTCGAVLLPLQPRPATGDIANGAHPESVRRQLTLTPKGKQKTNRRKAYDCSFYCRSSHYLESEAPEAALILTLC